EGDLDHAERVVAGLALGRLDADGLAHRIGLGVGHDALVVQDLLRDRARGLAAGRERLVPVDELLIAAGRVRALEYETGVRGGPRDVLRGPRTGLIVLLVGGGRDAAVDRLE